MNVGFVGTGTMGAPMLANLVKKGFGVIAYDVVRRPRERRKARRDARRVAADAARRSDLVITMLPRPRTSRPPTSARTGSPKASPRPALCGHVHGRSRGLAPRGAGARREGRPLHRRAGLGRRARAEEGTLAIMVGGEARDVEEARPALAAMGANVIHVGAVGSGEVAKLCNNLIAGVSAVAVSEAFRIAEGFGVDPRS